MTSLDTYGCYFQGHSVLDSSRARNFRHCGAQQLARLGLPQLGFVTDQKLKFRERLTAQFRAEFFNVLNHPNFANPYGASNGFGDRQPIAILPPAILGCGCATPDQAGGNPVLGSGGNRATQLGLKLIF